MAGSIDAFIFPLIIKWWKTELSILLDSDHIVIRRKPLRYRSGTASDFIERSIWFDFHLYFEFEFVRWPNNGEFNRSIYVRLGSIEFENRTFDVIRRRGVLHPKEELIVFGVHSLSSLFTLMAFFLGEFTWLPFHCWERQEDNRLIFTNFSLKLLDTYPLYLDKENVTRYKFMLLLRVCSSMQKRIQNWIKMLYLLVSGWVLIKKVLIEKKRV